MHHLAGEGLVHADDLDPVAWLYTIDEVVCDQDVHRSRQLPHLPSDTQPPSCGRAGIALRER